MAEVLHFVSYYALNTNRNLGCIFLLMLQPLLLNLCLLLGYQSLVKG